VPGVKVFLAGVPQAHDKMTILHTSQISGNLA
jgi:hypothetical protein